jgi:hypothetical protein
VRQKNRPASLLLLCPAAENPRSTLPEQMSESAEIWIRDPIGVPRCSPQVEYPICPEPAITLCGRRSSARCRLPLLEDRNHVHTISPFALFSTGLRCHLRASPASRPFPMGLDGRQHKTTSTLIGQTWDHFAVSLVIFAAFTDRLSTVDSCTSS